MARLEGDETKPGSKLKNRREVSAPRRIGSADPARWLVWFNQPDGRAFACYVVSSRFGRFSYRRPLDASNSRAPKIV